MGVVKEQFIRQEKKGQFIALQIVILNEDIEIMKLLVKAGISDIHARSKQDETPLHFATVVKGNLEIVQFLVEAGADIHARSKQGETPLHFATLKGNLEIVQFLVEQGADTKDLNAPYEGRALMQKVKNKCQKIFRLR